MVKRVLATGLATFFMAGSLISAQAFSDVGIYDSAYPASTYVQEQGIISGYPDGTFKPLARINRAEFTKIVVGAKYTQDQLKNCTGEFKVKLKDVDMSAWYGPYLCLAVREGIIGGYPDGTFKPTAEISFPEAAKIVIGVLKPGEAEQKDAIWYRPFVTRLGELHAIPTSVLSFEHKMTRGEVAEMVYRLMSETADKATLSYTLLENPPADLAVYGKWIIPAETLSYGIEEGRLDNPESSTDCVAMMSGDTAGGDLMSTLIVDTDARAMMRLKVLTPAYVKSLEGKIAHEARATLLADVYASQVCHLAEGVDLVAGKNWPQGSPTRDHMDGNLLWTSDATIVAVVRDGEVQLYDGVPSTGRTATGGEPPQCDATLRKDGAVLWDCFMGMDRDPGAEEPNGKWKYTTWTLNVDGTFTTEDRIEE